MTEPINPTIVNPLDPGSQEASSRLRLIGRRFVRQRLAIGGLIALLLVLPAFLIIAILSPTFRGRTWLIFVLLLAAFQWMITARIVRGLTLSLREREFVHAARFMGVPGWKIIFRHIQPNMASLLITHATSQVSAVRGLSYTVKQGEVLGLVGESGSGKTVSSLAIMELLPRNARVTGSVRFQGTELIGRSDKELSDLRGRKIAMIFQDPLSAL